MGERIYLPRALKRRVQRGKIFEFQTRRYCLTALDAILLESNDGYGFRNPEVCRRQEFWPPIAPTFLDGLSTNPIK
jgi:hypothetical protein